MLDQHPFERAAFAHGPMSIVGCSGTVDGTGRAIGEGIYTAKELGTWKLAQYVVIAVVSTFYPVSM